MRYLTTPIVRPLLKAVVPFVVATSLVLASMAAPRGVPAQNGILNFGKVADGLFRGAQPDANAVKQLKELGIKAIIDLRTDTKAAQAETAAACAQGILYTNIPLSGSHAPSDQQVQTVLAVIGSLPGPVFIHCKHGCDRTGTLVACYRIK